MDNMDLKGLVVGMDAGGTSTKVKIADLSGKVLDFFEGEGMNINSFGPEGTKKHLEDILDTIREKLGSFEEIKAMCIGIAGISNPDTQSLIKETILSAGITIEPLLVGDQIVALYGAEGTGEGIVLIAGTGSVCSGRRIDENGKEILARAGGWGHLIDDEGSAYALGRDVLTAVVRSQDGRGEKTAMWKAVKEQLHVESVQDLIRFVYAKETGKKEIASLAPIVMTGIEAGEETAFEILKKAAVHLADDVIAVADQLNIESGKVVLAGSVLLKNTLLQTFLKKELKRRRNGIYIGEATYDAAYGAVLAALEKVNA